MNNDDALYLLGIEAAADASAVRQAYERRRLEFEQRLTNTASEGLKSKYHSTLSDLDQAYRLLVGASDATPDPTIRRGQGSIMGSIMVSANASSVGSHASTGGTLLRSDGDALTPLNGLAIGHVLASRYKVLRLLGQGGMGAVYEAFDQLKQESVAIKVLLPQYLGNQQGRDRFMHEAKMACKLSHPNIVKVFDVGFAEPYYFITMELLEGQTLREQMEARKADREPYSVAQVLDCAKQLIAALEYAHKQIVHRDLKPENVWVCKDGTLKLIDFGIARAFTKSALTRTGMVMGTAYYMAPEQFNGAKDVDWHADQYSLAVMLYELLTGRIPQGTFSATSELRKDVPISMSKALMKALSPDPVGRFDSLANFALALSSRDPVRGFGRKTLLASGAAVVLLVIAGVWARGAFKRAPQSVATPAVVTNSPEVAASALEGEVLSLLKRLQEKEQELADNIEQQQLRNDRAQLDVQSARNGTGRAAAETVAAREARNLQLQREIQQEALTTVFSETQWSARSGLIHAGQALLKDGELESAAAQFAAVRESMLRDAKVIAEIDSFVHARADYFDARLPWLEFSMKHGGRTPANPAIRASEGGIQAAIDRGEYANLAANVFPQLTALYAEELRLAQRPGAPRTVATPATNRAAIDSGPSDTPAEPTPSRVSVVRPTKTTTPPTKQEIRAERARVAAERKHAALLEKCAKARRRPRGCPELDTN